MLIWLIIQRSKIRAQLLPGSFDCNPLILHSYPIYNTSSKLEGSIQRKMNEQKRAFLKPLLWAYGAVGVFTAISIVVPIIWERLANRNQ